MSTGPCILIVEDDKKMFRVFATSLETEGYLICDASNGQAAIAEVRTRNPDLILLDLGLPDIDGLQLVPQIREHSTAPIIVVSAREHEQDKVKALVDSTAKALAALTDGKTVQALQGRLFRKLIADVLTDAQVGKLIEGPLPVQGPAVGRGAMPVGTAGGQ